MPGDFRKISEKKEKLLYSVITRMLAFSLGTLNPSRCNIGVFVSVIKIDTANGIFRIKNGSHNGFLAICVMVPSHFHDATTIK